MDNIHFAAGGLGGSFSSARLDKECIFYSAGGEEYTYIGPMIGSNTSECFSIVCKLASQARCLGHELDLIPMALSLSQLKQLASWRVMAYYGIQADPECQPLGY